MFPKGTVKLKSPLAVLMDNVAIMGTAGAPIPTGKRVINNMIADVTNQQALKGAFDEPEAEPVSATSGNSAPPLTKFNGGKKSSILEVAPEALVQLENLSFRNGKAYAGGAIVNYGVLYVINCEFKNNDAQYGGAFYNVGALEILSSVVTKCQAACG